MDLIPKVHFRLDGHAIQLEDWTATSVTNGGYATLTGRASETDMRKYPSSFEQGAIIRGHLDNGRIFIEAELDANPIADNGKVELGASGPMTVAEERDDPLLYQDRNVGLFSDAAGAPFNGSPSAHVSAAVSDGSLHFEVAEGAVVVTNDAHALVAWLQGSTARRFRGTLYVSGTGSGWSIRTYRFTGPTWPAGRTTTSTTAVSNGALIDTGSSSTEDGIAVELIRTGANATQADNLSVDIRDCRINDLTTADDMSISAIVSDVGRRLGWDVEGIPVGPRGVDSATPGIDIFSYVEVPKIPQWSMPGPRGKPMVLYVGDDPDAPPTFKLVGSSHKPAVMTSPMNALPLAWGGRWGGTWASLLDYLASMLGWRWRVLGNIFGRGNVVQFGPYGPAWNVRLSKNASPSLRAQPISNVVIVRYATAARGQAEEVVRADPDPLKFRGRRERKHVFDLPDVQKDATLATFIANTLAAEVTQPYLAGTLDIVGADNGFDDMTIYDILGGDLVSVGDMGSNGAPPLRVAQVEMSPNGVRLGIDRPSSVAGMLAMQERAAMRKHFGTVRRREYLDRTEARRRGLL